MEINLSAIIPALTLIGVPVLRSGAGWAIKALEDNRISKYEWKLLASTTIRVSLISVSAYIGLNCAGIDVPAISAALAAIIADKLFKSLKENKNVTKR